MLLRHRFHELVLKNGLRLVGYNRVRGVPFYVAEVRRAIEELL